MKANRTTISITVVVLFHIVGLAGFFIPSAQPLFLKIVPFHLLLMLAVILYSYGVIDKKLIVFFLISSILGFLIEWLGVHYHLIFGSYFYGATLGLKLLGIPLMIGVNWFLIVYATGVSMQYLSIKNLNVRVVLGAIILVLLDLLIEPIAVKFDYWHWFAYSGTLTAPIENYFGWFMVSGLMLGVFEAFKFSKQGIVGPVLLAAQFIFFALLNLL